MAQLSCKDYAYNLAITMDKRDLALILVCLH